MNENRLALALSMVDDGQCGRLGVMDSRRQWDLTDLCGVALALERASQVVDNNTSSSRAKKSGVGLTKTPASPSNDDDLAVEPQLACHPGEDTVLKGWSLDVSIWFGEASVQQQIISS